MRDLSVLGILCLAAGSLVEMQPLHAHHSSVAVYDMQKRVSVTGVVSKIMWVNPHAYYLVDEKNSDGTVTSWEFLLNSPNEMMRAGWPPDTLKVGDVITVNAIPGRGRITRAFSMSATLANGHKVLTLTLE